jgi:hypothetical protein
MCVDCVLASPRITQVDPNDEPLPEVVLSQYCTLHPMHCMLCLESHACTFVLDPAEQEPEELQEPAPAKETNPEQEQGKPRCI